MIGASGAIAGVLGAYFILYPRARVMTLVFFFFFIRVIPIPAAIILGLWFLMQVLNIGLGGGVAWFAHIGGFLVGIGLIMVFRRRPRFAVPNGLTPPSKLTLELKFSILLQPLNLNENS